MAKQKRGNYEATLQFVLILAMLFAFASLVPLWEAYLRGVPDSVNTMFSIFFIFGAVTILQSIFKWSRATLLLVLAWFASFGIAHSGVGDIQMLSPIASMILIAFFLDEIYSRWHEVVQMLIDKNGFSSSQQIQEQDATHQEEHETLRIERLSTVIDETPYLRLSQSSQTFEQDRQ